jgi:hypothetical protein
VILSGKIQPEIVEQMSKMMADRQSHNLENVTEASIMDSDSLMEEQTIQLMTRIKSFFKGVF